MELSIVGNQMPLAPNLRQLVDISENDVREGLEVELRQKFGNFLTLTDVVTIFGKNHRLPVIEGFVSVDSVCGKLLKMRDEILCAEV